MTKKKNVPLADFRLSTQPTEARFETLQAATRPNVQFVLIGEGDEESAFLNKLLIAKKVKSDIAVIVNLRGNGHLTIEWLKTFVPEDIRPQIRGFFFLVDAEKSNFESVEAKLLHIADNFKFPKGLYKKTGKPQFRAGSKRSFSFFISPNHKDKGAFESLVLSTISSEPNFACLKKMFRCIQPPVLKFKEILDQKRALRAYLAAKHEHGSVKVAFDRGFLDAKHASYARISTMIDKMIEYSTGA
ncbi:MAG: hypothetical protein HY059_11660 [Proteobacteria bacterium]|nr:hypothetical protein [Pseudomonadota bacterium]